jgi:hypothetical protein
MNKSADKTQEIPAIKIIKVPAGDAPEWVRAAWVGLVLPCDPFVGYAEKPDKGVVTLRETKGRKGRSYAVVQKDAIEILSKSNPDAAKWWLSCGFPKFTPGEDRFGFDADVAIVATGVITQQEPGVVYDNMETGRWEPWIYPKSFTGAR